METFKESDVAHTLCATFNRTNLEWKLQPRYVERQIIDSLLIAPIWNGNFQIGSIKKSSMSLLIAPIWNGNMTLPASSRARGPF